MRTMAVLIPLLVLGFVSPAPAQVEPVRIHARLYKSSTDGTKFSPFRGNSAFQVTVRLYEGASGGPILGGSALPWEETLTITPVSTAPSSPGTGALGEPGKVAGEMDLLVGASVPLPADLLEVDAWFTTQVTTLKKGVVAKEFAESPRAPLGIAGFTSGQSIAPASVTTDELRVGDVAVAGQVLTADVNGHASWQPVPAGPGVTGTTGKVPVFTSGSSIGDSVVSQSGGAVTVAGNLTSTGTITGTKVDAGAGQLKGGDLLLPGAVITAAGDILGASVTAAGTVTASEVECTGNLNADSLLVADSLAVGWLCDVDFLLAHTGILCYTGLETFGNVQCNSNLLVGIDATVGGDATVAGDVAAGSVHTTGHVTCVNLNAGGSINGNHVHSYGDITAAGNVTVGGTVTAEGDITAEGDLYAKTTALVLGVAGDDSSADIYGYGDMDFYADYDATIFEVSRPWFRWYADGLDENMRLDNGPLGVFPASLWIEGAYQTGLADFAEYYPTTDSRLLPPGTVVAVDGLHAEQVVAAEQRRNEAVLGIVSTAPGFVAGSEMDGLRPDLLAASDAAFRADDPELGLQLRQEWSEIEKNRTDRVPVALSGRVPVRVDGSGGAIRPGDRLGLSVQPGLAARYTGFGPVVGIALQAWTGESSIVAFVHLDWSPEGNYQPMTELTNNAGQPAAALSDANVFPAGATHAIVSQAGLDAASRPVVTFFGNPGGSWWVSERGAGYFVLSLERPAPVELEFAWSLAH